LRDYFRSGAFTYDPEVRLGDDEAAVQVFLRDRRGFCVQFATAYALMARSLGIPARVAVGFTPGAHDDATGAFTVTNHDAHAWPEIWLGGIGWTHMFDPTPPSDLPGGSGLSTEPSTVTPPTAAPTSTPPTTVGPPATSAVPSTAPTGSNPAESSPRGGGVRISTGTSEGAGGGAWWPFAVVAAVAVLVLAPLLAVVLWKRRRRARRRSSADPRRAIVGAWHELIDTLTDHRIVTSPAETPYELAARVPADAGDDARPALRELAEVYTHARYATEPPQGARADAAWRDVDEVRRALDAREGAWARLRARLSPRTLGRQDRAEELV
jgi:hypothetical protein